jgi:hypothetical protein
MPTTPTASTNSLTIRVNQAASIKRIRIKQASSYLFKLAVKDGDTPFDLDGADVLCNIKSRDTQFSSGAVGTIISAPAGTAEILLEPGHTNYAGTLVFDIIIGRDDQELVHVWGEFVVEARAGNGTPIPTPPAILDWSKYTFLNTATHGPARAGTGLDTDTNPDGSETHSVKYGSTAGTALEGNATAADVDPAGTQIAGALEQRLPIPTQVGGVVTTNNNFTANSGSSTRIRAVASGGNREAIFVTTTGVVDEWSTGRKTNANSPEDGAWQLRDEIQGLTRLWVSKVTGIFYSVIGLVSPFARALTASGLTLQDSAGTTHATVASTGIALDQLTASMPVSLDANKRLVTLSAADFRALIGLVIGTDVQAQNADLQAWADAADAAERRALIDAAQRGTIEAITLDANKSVTATQNGVANIALDGGSFTLTIPNPPDTTRPAELLINFTQDTTPRTVTWSGNVKFTGGIQPGLSATAGAIDSILLKWMGTHYHAMSVMFDQRSL